MTTLAGHGKDERLIQVELPVVPNVGDRIREDCNPKDIAYKLDCLIREGKFIEALEKWGQPVWKVKYQRDDDKFDTVLYFNPDDCEIIDRAPVLVEKEISISLPEQITKPKAKPKAKAKPSLPKGIKVGDMVCNLDDGDIGEVTHLSDLCINIKTPNSIQSHSLKLGTPNLEILTHPNQSVVFAIGDRVTLASKNCDFGKFGMGATVIEKRWDKRLKLTRMSVQFDDGSIETNHYQGAGWFNFLENPETVLAVEPIKKLPSEPSPEELTAEILNLLPTVDNPKIGEIIGSMQSGETYLAEIIYGSIREDISGQNCDRIFNLFSKLNQSSDALSTALKVYEDSQNAFLDNFVPSIDADKLPVFTDAIATEPTESVANLRIDEGSVSVLVGIINDSNSVLVEGDDRYQFLLERREQLIESGASPQGVWINCGKVPHRDFKQAVWKSHKPRAEWGDKKSCYIGKFGKEEHLSAISKHRAGQELRKVEREIKKLQVKS